MRECRHGLEQGECPLGELDSTDRMDAGLIVDTIKYDGAPGDITQNLTRDDIDQVAKMFCIEDDRVKSAAAMCLGIALSSE